MYTEFTNFRRSFSLEQASENLNIEKPKYLHKSDDDSVLTMNLVKGMCTKLECSLEELIELCDSCRGKSENFVIKYDDSEIRQMERYESVKNGVNNTIKGRNYKMLLQFLDGVKPQGEIVESLLNGKTLCVSLNYEIEHFREMLSLIRLLKNHNATYKLRASDNDIFVTCSCKNKQGNERFCSRLKHVNEAIEKGKVIQIMTFEELLSILGVAEEDLISMPFPEQSSFYKKLRSKQKKKEPKIAECKPTGQTLGDYFSDIFEMLKNEIDCDSK